MFFYQLLKVVSNLKTHGRNCCCAKVALFRSDFVLFYAVDLILFSLLMKNKFILSILALGTGFHKHLLRVLRSIELADGSESGGDVISVSNEYWR